jgi:hypothetical protein
MKKYLLFIVLIGMGTWVTGQNLPPVAVFDTIFEPVQFGDTITYNVLLNDYDPDGDDFMIFSGGLSVQDVYNVYTDSTITFYFDPMNPMMGQTYQGEYYASYFIKDEFGNFDEGSAAKLIFYVENNSFNYLDINNISAQFNAFGNHFWDMDAIAHYRFPKESNTNTLFNFALWIGGLDEDNVLKLAAERYRSAGIDYVTGPLSYNADSTWIDPGTVKEFFRIWRLNKTQVMHHVLNWQDPNYMAIDEIMSWPAHGDEELGQSPYLAPFIDMNDNGLYEPMSGDYPLIRGDQTLFFIFNDAVTHSETSAEKIGVEIHGFAYAFDAPEDPYLNNTTFLSYKIFNRSQQTLHDTYVGLFTDIDVGYAWDDYVGCFIDQGAYYIYNGDSIDGEEGDPFAYGALPPAQGVVVLGGPYMDPNGEDDPDGECDESINGVGFGDGVVDNERFGMSRFIYFNNGGAMYSNDPQEAEQYYSYLQGYWVDGEPMLYGGNGHTSSGAYGPDALFMFPGTSDPCNWGTMGNPPNGPVEWTEVTAGNIPFDRRGMCSMGPFTLESGGFHKIDLAFVNALGDHYENSVDVLRIAIDSVKSHYFSNPDHFGFAWLGEKENMAATETIILRIFPNPATRTIGFYYTPSSNNARILIYNTQGICMRTELMAPNGNQKLNIEKLPEGIYLIKVIDENKFSTAKFIKR